MKKIKLVISDLHLGKGRRLESGMINPLEEFYFEDKLVEFIDFHSTGKYRDYEVELIINGDFLNFLQVDYHGHFLTVITEGVALEVLKGILDGQQKVFKALREFASQLAPEILKGRCGWFSVLLRGGSASKHKGSDA